jgi:3-phosphoshikimate 1-carboxyvinyltransferase
LRGEVGISGEPALPGDKSLSHRAALFAALADGESRVENFLVSGVTRAMLDALSALGVPWDLHERRLIVRGVGLQPPARDEPVRIDCGNSGTTMRLLAGALAAWDLPAVLDGSPGLRRRPMRRIVAPLQDMGVDIQAVDGRAPLVIRPVNRPLRAVQHDLPVASAQVKTCLLLAALAAGGATTLREPGPSRDHSERMLASMGAGLERARREGEHPYVTRLSPPEPRRLKPLALTLPGDISAAAFLVVAALITPGSEITLRSVGLNPTRTGLLEALGRMGADLQISNRGEQGGEPLGDLTVRYSRLRGVPVAGELVVRMIDEFPAFAVAAACAQGETVVTEAEELRYKESDRISALCGQLSALGADVSETPDGFVIRGGAPLRGGAVQPHGDHRLAMSLAVAGLAAQGPVTVHDAPIIAESFPAFSEVLGQLGAQVTWV